jgi:hypothetical protein
MVAVCRQHAGRGSEKGQIEHDRALVSSVWCGRLPWRGCASVLYLRRTSPRPVERQASLPSAPRTSTPWSGFFAALTIRPFGRLNLRSMPTLSSTRTEILMALQLGKRKCWPRSPGRTRSARRGKRSSKTPARPRARIAISFTATAARWASGDRGSKPRRLSLFRQQGAVEGRQQSGRYTRRSRPSVAPSPTLRRACRWYAPSASSRLGNRFLDPIVYLNQNDKGADNMSNRA